MYGISFARQIVATAKFAGSRGISFWIIQFYFVYLSRWSSRLSFLRIPANIVSFKISCRNYCLCSGVKKLILYPNINILAECIIAPRMTVRVALPLMIKPLLYVAASMLQTTIYALQCALTSNPTDSNTAQFRERSRTFLFSLRGEGKWSGDSRGISARWSGKELACSLYSLECA